VRWLNTICAIAFLGFLAYIGDKPKDAVSPAAVHAAEMESATDPVEFVKLIIDSKHDIGMKGELVDDKNLKIEYSLDSWALIRLTMTASFLVHAKQIVPAVFEKFPKIMEINLTGWSTFTDVRGHTSIGKSMMVRFSRENAATIDWKHIANSDVLVVADDHYGHL
jgi:hypothetical protein